MATLINLPHEVQSYISNYLRPRNIQVPVVNPFLKARDIAIIKAVHPNLKTVPLWKNTEWKERIRNWRDEHLMKVSWKYQYGILPEKEIQRGMENKINTTYRRPNCYVETVYGKAMCTGFVTGAKIYKIIYFGVNLRDLIDGTRDLPSIFGKERKDEDQAESGGLLVTLGASTNFVATSSKKTLIPKHKRRKWLVECFKECILDYYVKKIIEHRSMGKLPLSNFIKEFKKLMDLPSDYKLSQMNLFKMFLKELGVCSTFSTDDNDHDKKSETWCDIISYAEMFYNATFSQYLGG